MKNIYLSLKYFSVLFYFKENFILISFLNLSCHNFIDKENLFVFLIC